MKKPTICNIYENTLDTTWESFRPYMQGSREAMVCAISTQTLEEPGRKALNSSAEAFGYGHAACLFVTVDAQNVEALNRQTLFCLIEGVDPICLIATDTAGARLLGETYGCDVAIGRQSRVFGRTCVAFASFSAMLESEKKKQAAWALLKQLPRFSD